jgi:hypothetical protein
VKAVHNSSKNDRAVCKGDTNSSKEREGREHPKLGREQRCHRASTTAQGPWARMRPWAK